MNICDYAHLIVFSEDLESKLLAPDLIDSFEFKDRFKLDSIPLAPARAHRIKFCTKKTKFPKVDSFSDVQKRAQALHFFANHELLAIEMMACAILFFPYRGDRGAKFRKSLLVTIRDEQKHFRLYQKRMKDWDVEFGDFGVNDFFWRQMLQVKSSEQFYAVVALTFELANLDFAHFYRDVFLSVGDEKSAAIMQIILDDEISHVKIGKNWIEQSALNLNSMLWDTYQELLPEGLSPARSKGIRFNTHARKLVGFKDSFIDSQKNFKDSFEVVNRKKTELEI